MTQGTDTNEYFFLTQVQRAGVTDIEIHFLQIKFNAIGVYLDVDGAMEHLQGWKGKSQLMEDEAFFDALVSGETMDGL